MNFIEAAASARGVGVAIRFKGWVAGVAIRWNWDHLRWEGTSDFRLPAATWDAAPDHPNPNDIQRIGWEVVDLA